MKKKIKNDIEKYLIQQCIHPSGIFGSLMTKRWNTAFAKMTKWGLRELQFSTEEHILDVGCGGGATIHMLSKLLPNGKVYGVDISKVAIKNTTKLNKFLIQRNKVEIVQSTVEQLPFSSHMFDKVFVIQTHMYWSNVERGLKELVRVVKPNGRCYIICEKDKIEYHIPEYKEWMDMVTLLNQVGFTKVKYKTNKYWVKYECSK